ncbi:MAG: hypothetical protein J6U11_00620, partial [Campylobacter sp.]|nr:hypothetical protein [Campylobacter sp.]
EKVVGPCYTLNALQVNLKQDWQLVERKQQMGHDQTMMMKADADTTKIIYYPKQVNKDDNGIARLNYNDFC